MTRKFPDPGKLRPAALRLGATFALLGGTLVGCAEPPAEPRPNVLLISIDTLRPDHLGSYGYEKPTSPALDEFRRDAVLFETAIAQAPSTLHSHASMLTSLLPHHHGASWGAKTEMANGVVSIAEVLAAAGYETVAFTGGGQMDRVFGLAQGFDEYLQPGVERFDETVALGLEWLEGDRDRPFFLFLHSYETHHPYGPPAELLEIFDQGYEGELPAKIELETLRAINSGALEIDEADLDHIRATYDAEIRSMDQGFARLLTGLKEQGLYEDTLIVFTSDHGEEFGEHGRVGWHSHSLYDELLRVPLIVKYPGRRHAGASVAGQVRSIDIPPTILAAAGLEAPRAFLGVDLESFAAAASATTDLTAISRMDREATRDFSSVRTEQWKLMPPPRGDRTAKSSTWLFDLAMDPEEQWDTATSHLAEKASLEEALKTAIESRKRWSGKRVAPTKKTLDELKALGYLE